MDSITFFTNLSSGEIIRDFHFISENNLVEVENVFGYLDMSVAVTALPDRIQGEIVHIFQEDGKRLRLSRIPKLYYSSELGKENLNFI